MSNSERREHETSPLSEGAGASDHFELKHILEVAAAYLEAGHVGDASDLLQEALEADANHPDVVALARRIAHVTGGPTGMLQSDVEEVEEEPEVIVNFTAPLPGVATQPPAIQRLVATAEQHYASDRIYSALDLTHTLCAEAPGFLPGYVRLAELQIALGKVDQARSTFDTLKLYYAFDDDPAPWLVEALGIALNPGDTSALIGYAMTLFDAGDASMLDPFVPEAIRRAVDLNVAAAREMAERYLSIKEHDTNAQQLYLSVLAAAGDASGLIESARTMVQRASSVELIAIRVAAETADSGDTWLGWLESLLDDVRGEPGCADSVLSTWSAIQIPGSRTRMDLAHGLLYMACERWSDAHAVLADLSPALFTSSRERFAAQFARATTRERLGDPLAPQLLLDVAQVAYSSDVEPFARQTTLFGVSAAPVDMLRAAAVGDDGAAKVQTLVGLRDANPARLDIRSALADAYIADGNVNEAVRELRFVAQEHERSGNLAGMIEAMRSISRAVPENLEMKAKLIEGYLRRGVLNEAVDELDRISVLYLKRNRTEDAVAALTKAAEIASALGEFGRGNELFDRAVLVDPDNVPVRHAAVAFYLQTGAIDNATAQLREVVRIALAADDRDEAVAALHQIIALAPQDPDAYHKLGEVLTSLGEYTQAERVYRRLATFTPFDPVLEAKQSALAVLAATK